MGDAPKPNPPSGLPFAGAAGVALRLALPKMETRSSSGLLDVPESRLAAAGVEVSTVVAARPEGWPSLVGSSEKSSKFSACWPAATVCSAFCAAARSSAGLDNDD